MGFWQTVFATIIGGIVVIMGNLYIQEDVQEKKHKQILKELYMSLLLKTKRSFVYNKEKYGNTKYTEDFIDSMECIANILSYLEFEIELEEATIKLFEEYLDDLEIVFQETWKNETGDYYDLYSKFADKESDMIDALELEIFKKIGDESIQQAKLNRKKHNKYKKKR